MRFDSKPFIFLSFILFAFSNPLLGQSREITPMNRHFFEIPEEDQINLAYTLITTEVNDSLKFRRFHNLENKIIKNVTIRKNPKDGFKEGISQTFDESGNLESVDITNLETGVSIKTYYFDSKQVAQSIKIGKEKYQVLRAGDSIPTIKEVDDFIPRLNTNDEEWDSFFKRNFKVNGMKIKSDYQTAFIAVLVGSDGKRKEIEVANPDQVEDYFELKALELIYKWGDNFLPALDSFGNPVEKWLYIPISFQR